MKALRSTVRLACVIGLATGAALPVNAQQCPDQTVHLIVGYSQGGTGDIVATAVSDALSRRLGQKVVVDYRPGASGSVAAQDVAKAAPDGCTLLIGQTAEIAINPTVMRNLGYDPTKDLKPVGLVAKVPLALVVARAAPYASVADLIQAARAARPALTFASAGRATPGYFAGELLRLRTRTNMAHIAFDGGGAALNAVLAGQANLYFPALPTAIEEVRKGQLKILAVTSPQRSFAAPDAPTLDEAGLSPFNLDIWVGLFAPRNTPDDLVARVNRELNEVLRQSEIMTALLDKGASVTPMTAEQFAGFVAGETKRYATLIDTEFCSSCPW
jgi:tripartite-type tricarboxylate transporter receptor subunit TctC